MDAARALIVPHQDGLDTEDAADPAVLEPLCQRCAQRLDLCQPSLDEPDELLGTCRCGAWHHVAYQPDRSAVLVTYLPLKTRISEDATAAGRVVHDGDEEDSPPSRSRWT